MGVVEDELSMMRGMMTKEAFLSLMQFPKEWLALGMYRDELFMIQSKSYVKGNEESSEHFRFGAFLWWVSIKPSKKELAHLIRLSFLDTDDLMAADARRYLRSCENFDSEHHTLMLILGA